MNIEQLVADFAKQGVKLWVEGEQLRANAPKGVLTTENRDLLAKNKAELILLLQEKNTDTDTDLPLTKAERPQNLPLSFAQERLWLLDQLEPDNPFYNEQAAIKLHGQLNVVALEQSLNKIIDRHEVLRTNFRTINEQPVQVIADNLTLSVPVVDFTELPQTEREIACQQLVAAEATRPFDLASSPLIRVSVIKLTQTEHVLLLTIHHIVYDGWSMGVLMRELATVYSALCNNSSPKLPELPIQYADYAIWQRQWLQAEVLQTQLDYWKQLLKNAPTLLEVPTDRPRPAIQTFRGAIQSVEFSIELSQALAKFSRQQGSTLFMTLFAAYVTLLYRYTGSDDIVVGTPIAGRDRLELEGLIGFFINTLVLRTDLSGNPSFKELLSRIRQRTLEAYAHANLPFEELVKALQPQRDLSHTPLCQVIFALENEPISEIKLSGLTVSPFGTERTTAKFDLTLSMQNTSTGLIGVWQYNTDLFDASTIEQMSGHFQTLLSGIVANPQQQISQLPLLTEPEQHQLLVEWNNTQADYPQDKCIHQLFEEQVERTPHAVAVEFVDTHSASQQLTYYQLNCRANQLAHYLKSLGVGTEVLVGICVERSLDMLVGLLAILKAGGAYVPLDPAHPPERIALMLEDAQISVLLTQAELVTKLPDHQAQVVCLNTDWAAISQQTQANLFSKTTSENLAYIIYTSGSTGKPKGVQICHKSVTNFLNSMRLCVGLTEKEIFLAITTISFDMAVLELYFPLIAGGQVMLASREIALDGKQLEKLVDKATIMHATPATWTLLLAAGWQGNPGLKILCGGEALPRKLALELGKKGACAWNLYGPTETTVCLTAYKLEANQLINQTKETIPIGRLFAHNAQIYILDSHLQPVPVGVLGELYIGGVGVARGYLNRPELTQEKFISNPFNADPDSRLYKTGDLARYLNDGNIEYLERIDNQVKIRGLRIELGEIEAVLSQHGDVEGCCVIAREDLTGDTCTEIVALSAVERSRSKRLVAYVVADQDCKPTINQLRQFLKTKLPEYMIPNAFVMLESLPITPSGKVDRRALPAPDLQSTNSDKYVAPRSPIEEMLSLIWAQVLKVELVGIDDNFFELGGHSLLATQLVSRIRNIFKVELPLRELFAASTVGELARSLEQLQQQDLELVAPPILSRTENAPLPLSYAQQRLWFLDQLQPNSALYNIPLALRLIGTLDQVAFEQSLIEIINRHEVLRTNLITVDGQSSQIIRELLTENSQQGIVSIVDLKHLPTSEQEIATQQLAQQEAQKSFDLASEPLVRVILVVLSETEQVLSVCMHHIVSDGWSTGVFISELAALYNAYSQGQPSPLAPLPIQYADFAIWQREWLQGDVLQTQLLYWQQQLKDAPALLMLPTDRPRPAVQTFNGAYLEFALSEELTQKLTKLSQQQGCTLFMTLLAAYDTLLYRYTGTDDILVGSPIANRDRLEIEGLIGFFVNTLVLRTNLVGDPSFSELLSRVREIALGAYSHQDLPFEMLVEALQPERNMAHTPLFQVMFVLQNAPMSGVELAGLTISSLNAQSATAKFDLSLSMQNTATGLVGVWEYNTDLFDTSTIERMAGHFVTLLEGIVANPKKRISQLPMLTEVEQYQLLVEWNSTQVDYPIDKCIHQLFEEQVARTPDAVAVVFENQQLTYQQLNCRANSLAHYLRSLGVEADVLVGICVERSIEMLVGLLGILKAGGAYVPLDPDYPQDRLSFILNDAALPVLLTQQSLLESLPECNAQVVCLDSDRQLIAQYSCENPLSVSKPENLAYVIYTSGSTGQPKGVEVNHNCVVNFLASMSLRPGLSDSDTFCAVTTISFDIAALELYLPLMVGAKVVLVAREVASDGVRLLLELQHSGATVMQATPATWQMLLASGLGTQQLGMKLLCGGEALPTQLAEQLLETGSEIWNLYGPTETTIWSSIYQLRNEPTQLETKSAIASIGRAIANTQIYILDTQLQPVPVGVPGELHIGGAGLAKGYLNRPELTQEKFIPNPFQRSTGAESQSSNSERLYKTGDLARYLTDGNIEYLGRIDNQVKVRGFRIELGEIEAVLNRHEDVQACCVIAREDLTGDTFTELSRSKRLVAYIVPHQHSTPTSNQLRQLLRAKLPEYMVPNAFVMLESMPLTPNGKVDRRALKAPDLQSERTDKYIAPRTPIEELLTQIWAQVLKVEQVGIADNFFTLGGHSLLATQLVSRIRSIFKVELPLRELFAKATVAELALFIEQLQQRDLELSAPPILPRAKNSDLPLSYAQQRLWFLDQLEPNSAVYNLSIALRIVGNFNQAALEQSLIEIITRHEALRTNFITVDGKSSQIFHPEANWRMSVIDCEDLPLTEKEIATQQLVQQQAIQPFDLANTALIRATLVVLSKTEHVLLVCMHHVISDAWSLGLFISELAALYNAYAQGQSSPLTPLPIQYADFALWQREWLQGDVLQSQLSYWQQQLKDAPALLSLPTDRSRPAVQTFNGAHQEFALSVELTDRLITLSQEQGVTLFMTLLAAFDTLLYRYTGQSDILVGSPIANRNRSEIEGLIGFFVNTLVMRTDLSGNPSFSELLGRVREMAMDAYSHQDLPFEMLVDALKPERHLSHTPLFQVMFVLQNAPMSRVEFTGLTLDSLPAQHTNAKFDLTLSMHQSAAGLVGVWEYNTDLFDASTIERMTGHFVTLLEGIVANPEERISQLPLLTSFEQQQLLVEWNNTRFNYPQDKCIHQLFEEQVELTPDAVAVVFENQQLTYRQLNCRANQLAHYLQTLGVKPEVLVGLCVERSIEMIVGLLSILKAGGAYVPLDPDYPTERLSFMLQDAQIRVLLTQELHQKLPQHQAQVVCLDTDWQSISACSQDNPITDVQDSNLAYVIYTSGSTGKPKGVAIEHHSPVTLVYWAKEVFTTEQCAGVLASTSICFDLSVFELFVPLSCGGKIILALNALHLPSLPFSGEVTLINMVPSAIAELQRMDGIPVSVQTVNLAGEPLPNELVQKIYQLDTIQQVFNLYGPSEDTTYSTFAKVEKAATQPPSIGRPIANTQIYILDAHEKPVPVGVAGELHIGGLGLARGYLNRKELTQEKFIANPFKEAGESRLYKTGDLARYLADGKIEYIGRIDNQVKIRGFRIELGEIEAVLSQHEDVQACCVIAREDNPGDKRLVAYVVPHVEHPPTVSQLRSFLTSQLPTYMVPHAFVMLESLPVTPNGKIDRRALPAPDSREGLEVSFVAPRTPIEEILAQIWASVLGVELVGIHNNFFELGGDSILSIQIIAKAKLAGLQLSLKQLFAHQTIAQLATVADTIKITEAEQGLVTGTLPLTPIQKWLFEQNLEQPHHYNQAFLLSVPSEVKPELLKPALQQLLLHHDALRLRYTQTDSTWQQIHSNPTDNIALCDIDLSALPENEQKAAIETQAACLQASLNLSENLIQIALFHLGIDKRARLLIIIHHLVVDGVSWRILLEDLQTAYQQLAQGKELVLPTKTTSFKDWSNKLTQLAQSNALKQEAAYWLNNSRTCIPPIPVDHRQQTNTVVSTNTVSVVLNEIETRALLQDVPKAYNTQINDVLLTALGLVLSKWTNSSSVLFNLEGHGREDIVDGVDLSRTIGWFTTIFPVVLQLPATKNLADAIKSVKEQLRAIPNKGIGYGLLRYLSQDADIAGQLQALPIAQISFNYLGQFDQLLNTSSWMQQAFESTGGSHGLENNRPHLLDINSVIAGERLQIDWTYSTNIHQHTTIESLAQEFVLTLQELIAHCSSPENVGYTPTDFELAKLNQLELDQLLASLGFQNQSGKTNWRNIEDIYPLSPMQQGMLFESLYAPSEGVYFEQFSFTLSGSLNVKAFEQAWQQVVARHSILRTAFIWEQLTQPLQVVYRSVDVQLQFDDWQQLEVHQQQQQLEQHLHSQRQQGFQLSVAPLMHLDLIQLRADSYQFIWNHHHLLLDGWSMPLVLQDLLQFYGAISQGETLALQPTPSYRNYVAWLQKQDLTKAEEFWQQKLFGFSAPTPLIVDKPSSNQKQQYSIFSEQKIQLTAKATTAIQTFARQHQLTINNLVQATWALLLCRYSQETDVVFGATVSGRPPELVGIESMVGIFINTLPVRVQVWQDTQVLDLLKDLQAHHVESEQYSYSSLVEIQGLSDVPNGTPLFESIVVFENYPVDEAVQSQNYSFSIDNFHAIEKTNYPLTLIAAPGEQLLVKISYDTSRFDDAVITRLLGHFQTLLAGIVANAEQSIWQLPLLTLPEQQQLLVEWNQTQAEYPIDKCLHQLFEEQVARTPDAVAVVFENEQLTYYQLNTRANSLAHYLQSLGVKPDVLVGICVERSIDMIVGLLGILKAGGAYLPLDPQYPTERLAYMLNDSLLSVLLTQEKLLTSLPEHGARVVCFDQDWEDISKESKDNPISDSTNDNLAYVIYTSGSTGQPKGTLINHSNVVRLFAATNSWYNFNAEDVWTMFHSYAFDFSVWEIWGALLYGGQLVVVPYLVTRSPESFYKLLCREKVTILNQTPSAFRQLIQAEQSIVSAGDLNLRLVIFGGEALEIKSLQPWFERHGDQSPQLVNMYGITETTVHVTYRPLSKADLHGTGSVIGRPIPDLQVYLLDEYLQPVPIGVLGEMYVGGKGVARGYLNRSELTQQRFISHTFSDNSQARLYKTGDLARYLPNGELEYLGRVDNQVKIRGFRIELGEIEAVLSQHNDVQISVVIAREDTPGDQRLVAYVVPHQYCTPIINELRQFLKAKLPEYMVPNAFVMLESMPLTPNGKVDRRALPAPDLHSEIAEKYVAPRSPIEEILAEIWSAILKVELVGVDDNFFEIGGHSLLATQLVSRIRDRFKVQLPLHELFNAPTIAELAQSIGKLQQQNLDLTVPRILPRSKRS